MVLIVSIAAAWHLGIIGLTRVFISRRSGPSLKRLVRLIEIGLIRKLKGEIETLPSEKRESPRFEAWLKEADAQLQRLEEKDEKSN